MTTKKLALLILASITWGCAPAANSFTSPTPVSKTVTEVHAGITPPMPSVFPPAPVDPPVPPASPLPEPPAFTADYWTYLTTTPAASPVVGLFPWNAYTGGLHFTLAGSFDLLGKQWRSESAGGVIQGYVSQCVTMPNGAATFVVVQATSMVGQGNWAVWKVWVR